MHRGHHHDQESGGSPSEPEIARIGHNQGNMPVRPAQWQVLHGDPKPGGSEPSSAVIDLDLVEAAFAEGFLAAGRPTSFFRVGPGPFQGTPPDRAQPWVIRVENDSVPGVRGIRTTPVRGTP